MKRPVWTPKKRPGEMLDTARMGKGQKVTAADFIKKTEVGHE